MLRLTFGTSFLIPSIVAVVDSRIVSATDTKSVLYLFSHPVEQHLLFHHLSCSLHRDTALIISDVFCCCYAALLPALDGAMDFQHWRDSPGALSILSVLVTWQSGLNHSRGSGWMKSGSTRYNVAKKRLQLLVASPLSLPCHGMSSSTLG